MARRGLEVADIFRAHGPAWRAASQSLAAAPWHLGAIIVVGGRLRQEL